MEELEGTIFGHYLLKRRLARGGMSQVYLACDQRSLQEVAIKIVSRENSEHASRIQREINALSNLSHEHILTTLDYGEEGSWLYMVMPYIEHGTLRDLLHAKGQLTPEEAGKILVQVCVALQFAHDHGIIHRDIKPSNILLQRGEHVYLSDFGLVKEVEDESDLTMTGCLIGTPEYMAPELAVQPASKSSDVYALGIVLYQMLTGKTPFRGTTPLAVYWKHIQEQPLPPSLLDSTIPWSVEQVVLCALEKDPEQRFKNPQALARAYAQALLYARKAQSGLRITVPLATAARVSTGPLSAQDAIVAGEQDLLDMRRLTSVTATNRVEIVKLKRSPFSRKVMTGVLAAALVVAIPFSFAYSLLSSATQTQTVWGASAPFSSSLVHINTSSSSRKISPTPTTTTTRATGRPFHQTAVVFYPRKSTPPPAPPASPVQPNKSKHGHRHGHGDK